MTPEEFKTHATTLHEFHGKEIIPGRMKFWFTELRNVPGHVFHQAIIDLCNYGRYMPTLDDVKKACAKYKRREEERSSDSPENEPVLTTAEIKFNQEVAPEFFRFLETANRLSEETKNQAFASFMLDFYGAAVKYGVHRRIPWAEFEGQYGFSVPAQWYKTPATFRCEAPDVQEETHEAEVHGGDHREGHDEAREGDEGGGD